MSSPSQTPNPLCSAFQPRPREPTYTDATYKPPSLYPNEKQRLDPTPPSTRLTNNSSRTTSPGRQLPAPSSRPLAAINRSTNSQNAANGLHYFGRRYSVQRPAGLRYFPGPPNVRIGGIHPYRTPNQKPTLGALGEETLPATALQGFARDAGQPYTQNGAAYEAANGYQPLSMVVVDTRHSVDSADHVSGRAHLSHREDHPPAYDSDGLSSGTSLYHQSPYDTSSFFMPSQYEYKHGRARNGRKLSKQSTEIMKRWFDQNITYPYPSEEQKARFSRATGLSTTQVSNWFINYRRRCPELRDRREKHHGISYEGELV
ncbi:homeodomain super [Recurvomyces mirabilis]|nr:homeodomain super [Recurvomyces mirabilis]